ncbi:Pyridine nucleotide-disulfide oxidoreductase class-2 [Lasiodiplodia theobromae]|uniref:Pyridine nucleotide-disulfide oxidoreductase class-2 n=1 Tax=Lasiodiplodia theobromae TaxID=45133 RepID=UPI0015C35B3E|nr:Pyridine nucleotide-disulfide oxidoreductase class-2 [Lasiodiplodia theobromae]KAF4546529.1 Pyridine nucleotide-disulfide oxidoreductase class-2 [Lasiodiplodia theobromae]KAF9631939.1 Pyridine nucleotide-disulfide oxidoreductase class-2 [Lasiodiplodia theobromae]
MSPLPSSNAVDVLIVGAGLSAALALARARRSTVVFDSGVFRNKPAKRLHNLLTWDHQDPANLRAAARKELLEGRYNTTQWVSKVVTSLSKQSDGKFKAVDASGAEWFGDRLVLAMGVKDMFPDIPGFAECWGKSIHHCMFCHGFEETGAASAGVLATDLLSNKEMCVMLASMARQFVGSIVIYTNGSEEVAAEVQSVLPSTALNYTIDTRKTSKVAPVRAEDEEGSVGGITLYFPDDDSTTHAFLAYHPRTSANVGGFEELGLELSPSGGEIKTSGPFQETNVPGCYAVGDVGNPMKALVMAMAAGSVMGPAIVHSLIKEGNTGAWEPKVSDHSF